MLLKTADWDDAGQTHNALATESKFVSYQIVQEFNRPARATITLIDPDGSMAQKYDVDAANDSVYIGPGRAYIEDPTGTAIFEGRIIRAIPDMDKCELTLECEDWLGQLDDDRITYDMRESLNAAYLRQSTIHTDADNGTFVGPAYATDTAPVSGAVSIDGAAEADDTTDANDADANDMELLPAGGAALGDAYCLGFGCTVRGLRINIGTAAVICGGPCSLVITWKYSQGGDVWANLAGVTDDTDSFQIAGANNVTWTIPVDWAQDSVGGITAYWVKAEVTEIEGGPLVTIPIGTQAWGLSCTVFDDAMAWGADTYNNMYMVLTAGMAGANTWRTGPYQGTNTGADTYGNDPHVVWVDDSTTDLITDNDGNYTLDYDFRMYLGHNTPSDFYVHDSISAARLTVVYLVTGDGTCKLQIDNKTDGWIDLEELNVGFGTSRRLSVVIPTEYITKIIDANGIATVRFAVTWGSGDVSVAVKYLMLEVETETTGYSSAIPIMDTTTNYLQVSTDLSPDTPATCIWEGVPYSIARPIYKHIDTGESGTLVDNGAVVYAMTAAANIEHTSGLSTRRFIERTRLEILQALAKEDAASFWVGLGTVALTWKSTFNNGAPTALTDTSFLMLQGDYNYQSMFNTVTIQGARIGTYQIEQTVSDATSVLTYGINKTKIEKNTGVVSDYDAAKLADLLSTRDKDVKLYLQAELPGLSSLRLGDEVSITSTYLGLTAQVYTITHWAYQSSSYKTSIRLQPRASTTGYQTNLSLESVRMTTETSKLTSTADKYVSNLITQELTPV